MGDLGAALTARFLDDLGARLEKIEKRLETQEGFNNRLWKLERALDMGYSCEKEVIPESGIVKRLEDVEAKANTLDNTVKTDVQSGPPAKQMEKMISGLSERVKALEDRPTSIPGA